jgi:hypothetical protein
MAFYYRRNGAGDGVIPAPDFPLNATYAATAKEGDVVRLNASGEVVLALTGDTTVLGVVAGFNYNGIGALPTVAKVHTSGDAVYEATKVGAGALTRGVGYGIDASSNLDTADTTVVIAKIVAVVDGKPYVQITARQLV